MRAQPTAGQADDGEDGAGMRQRGFTLIELMIVVAIIGILAAIALPLFNSWLRRSKTSEATANLKAMFVGASSYYLQERSSTGLEATTSGHCTVAANALTPADPGEQKQNASADFAADESFRAIGFHVSDPVYFGYQIAESGDGKCGNVGEPGVPLYYFRAAGDLDGDDANSLFELAVGADASNNLYRSPGFYVVDDLE